MGNRLSKIVTRTGDDGTTGLADGARLAKDDARIALIGDVDELNSWIGVVVSHLPNNDPLTDILVRIQHDLFDLGGGLALPGASLLGEGHITRLDDALAALNKDLSPLKEFILPGGAPVLSWLHIARTNARKVERSVVACVAQDEREFALPYLNRLSDLLFVAARAHAKTAGIAEVYWQKDKSLIGQ